MKKELSIFTSEIEQVISSSIQTIPKWDWDEDYITRSVIRDIYGALRNAEYEGRDYRKSISWEMYKLRGKEENLFGDICFVVSMFFKDGSKLSGSAFLEAKKRYWGSTAFDAMRIDQAKRILKNAPRAQYLLYDYENITAFQSGTSLMSTASEYFRRFPFSPYVPTTNAVCCPLNLAVASTIKDTTLYRHSAPLSEVITGRFMHGLDLEFTDTAMQIATGHLEKHGFPANIIEVTICDVGVEPRGDLPQINQRRYLRIEQA